MYEVNYTNGKAGQEFETIQEAAKSLLSEYPDGVIYDAGGFEQSEYSLDSEYDVRNERAALVWASEEDSVNDDGAKAVASINAK